MAHCPLFVASELEPQRELNLAAVSGPNRSGENACRGANVIARENNEIGSIAFGKAKATATIAVEKRTGNERREIILFTDLSFAHLEWISQQTY